MNFWNRYVFFTKSSYSAQEFSGWLNYSCAVIASIFFENSVLKNVKKIEKIHTDSENSINSFKIKKDRTGGQH